MYLCTRKFTIHFGSHLNQHLVEVCILRRLGFKTCLSKTKTKTKTQQFQDQDGDQDL